MKSCTYIAIESAPTPRGSSALPFADQGWLHWLCPSALSETKTASWRLKTAVLCDSEGDRESMWVDESVLRGDEVHGSITLCDLSVKHCFCTLLNIFYINYLSAITQKKPLHCSWGCLAYSYGRPYHSTLYYFVKEIRMKYNIHN